MKHLADVKDRKSLVATATAFEHWVPKANIIRPRDIPLRCSKGLYSETQRNVTAYLRQWMGSNMKQDIEHAKAWERQPNTRKLSYLMDDLNYVSKIYTLLMISSPVNIDPEYIRLAAAPKLGNPVSDWAVRMHQFDLLKAIDRIPAELAMMHLQSPFDIAVYQVIQDRTPRILVAKTLGATYVDIVERINDHVLRMEFVRYITTSELSDKGI